MLLNRLSKAVVAGLLLLLAAVGVSAQKSGHTLRLSVTDGSTGEAVVMGTIELLPSGAATTTDLKVRLYFVLSMCFCKSYNNKYGRTNNGG